MGILRFNFAMYIDSRGGTIYCTVATAVTCD